MHLSSLVVSRYWLYSLLGGCVPATVSWLVAGQWIQLELYFSVCLFFCILAWHSLVVIAEVPKSRPTCTGTFQAFGHIIPANILLAKTSHVTEHKNQGVGIYTWPLYSEEFQCQVAMSGVKEG